MTEEELDSFAAYLQSQAETLEKEAEEKRAEAAGVWTALSAFKTRRDESRRLKKL